MMGQLSSGQERLFYSFNIEDHIPANHLLRNIDRCLDLSDLRHYLADFYSPIGRPSIDPELMICLLIVGYCYGIRSERRLCEEAHLNLAYRWFCLSLTDPLSRWTAAPGGPAFFAYSTNYLIDVEHGVIMDVEPTPAHRTAEVESTKTMIERVEEHFDIKPDRLIGDTAYGTAPMLAWMVDEKEIEPHVPVWDKTERKNESISISDFQWREEAQEYRCPTGHALRSEWRAFKNQRSHVTKADTIIFRSRQTDCSKCSMKERCCPNTSFRKIARSCRRAKTACA
ncbi:transposase [Pseudomonas sp. IT-P218]